jgi:PilZ domain
MTADMAFECLLVSSDPGVFGTIDRILRELSIRTNICLRSSRALNLLAKGNTDLIVIDWEGEASSELLHEIWKSDSTRKPTIVAISTVDCPIPGAHVVLRKPVTAESGTKALKSAYFRMVQDHRAHARYALMTPLIAVDESNETVPVTITDIGGGGVGLNTKVELTIGDILSFRLPLPGVDRDIYVKVRVLWTREYGAVGCEFLRIPPVDVDILHDWFKSKSQIKKPLIDV